ncbi:F-box protein At5g03100 [Linum perenne]
MATKHKRIKSPTNGGGGVDHISKLPDEILHNILRRSIERRAEPPRTAVLSRRWRSIMSSYPAVQFRSTRRRRNENFQKFVYTTLKRFSLHKLMRMETLDIWLKGEEGYIRSGKKESNDHQSFEILYEELS